LKKSFIFNSDLLIIKNQDKEGLNQPDDGERCWRARGRTKFSMDAFACLRHLTKTAN
jgi:hypothetical protein